jgi:hypothetical protein
MQSKSRLALCAALAATAVTAPLSLADNILSPSDFIIAIDNNRNLPGTYPTTENPPQILDQNPATKYLNFGRNLTGFIVIPQAGASTIKSFTLTTAGDAPERDPASYQLFGTNAPINSADNGDGKGETYTLIQSGALSLSQTRNQLQAPIDLANSASYAAYKLVFPQLKQINAANAAATPNSMQIADVQFFTAPAAGGTGVLAVGDNIRAVDETDSAYPVTERPLEAIDGSKAAASKYLNFGREGTGLIITPVRGSSVVKGIQLTTANDTPSRDPSHYELYGTNGGILSTEHSLGDAEAWTLIASGDIVLPDERNVDGNIIGFNNSNPYTSYKLIFTENKGPDTGTGSANSIQFSEVALLDSVPEPTTGALALGAAAIGLVRRRGRQA